MNRSGSPSPFTSPAAATLPPVPLYGTIGPGYDPETVKAHCRKHLARYKVPRQVEFVDDLPKSPIGKVLRKDLRADYLKDHPQATDGSPAC